MASELFLEVVEGPDAGRRVALDAPVEIGRDAASGLRLDDPYVSAVHARVVPGSDGVLVEDLGDPGGTFVNDAELAAPTHIRPGDEIQVGVTVLRLRTAAEVAAEPSVARAKPPPLAAAQREPAYVPAEVAEQDPALAEVEALLDAHTKSQARTAPLALLVLVTFVVLLFLATARP